MAKQRAASGGQTVSIGLGDLNEKQELFCASRCLYTMYGGAKGGGKAVTVDTPVCTPFGFRRMGDLRVGQTVIGGDGSHTKIIGVYPQGVQKTYRVTFIDGAWVDCTADHLWTARHTARHTGWKVYTTGQLIEILSHGDKTGSLLIPMCGEVKFTRGRCGGEINPYTLGVLLGDGCLVESGITVTSDDEEMFDLIRSDGYEIRRHNVKRNIRYGFLHFTKEREWLSRMGLRCRSESKYVPDGYKYAPVPDRYAILQGLMDTDGYADERGHCEFCSVSKRLAEDVQWLVRSLGGKATIREKSTFCYSPGYEKPGQTAYIVYIQTRDNEKLFRLERKRVRCRGKSFNGGISELCRRIVSIEPSGEAECQCIAVDNPDSLYVTKDFVVTHNTHVLRVKAIGGAQRYPGIKILIMRATYKDLERNHIEPILKMLPPEIYSYNGTSHLLKFSNGSVIEFGHWQGDSSEQEYNGIEYDWIFVDEATQFTERAFQFLGGCLRGANDIPKRMYLTCNPGGVGHRWVKEKFIDRRFKQDDPDPEKNENPDDFLFIPATVEDNTAMLNSPGGANYLRMLANMPENLRDAYRYGNWEILGGNYFPEFSTAVHVRPAFKIPAHWPIYRSFDYGLDKFAAYFFAVDEDGRSWCFREVTGKDLIVKDASEKLKAATLPGEKPMTTYAPPDMWNRQKDTGKTMAALFMQNGVPVTRSDNNRVQGHMMMKDMLCPAPLNDPFVKSLYGDKPPASLPLLMFFPCCKEIISDLQDIQADEKNPNDCAKDPHEITHTVDGVRYYCIMRVMEAEAKREASLEAEDESVGEQYEDFMCGGDASGAYLSF